VKRPGTTTPQDFRRLLRAARRGETLVVGAFASAILLLALGSWAVWRAEQRHRATAEETLNDQASYIGASIALGIQQPGWVSVRTVLRTWNETVDEHRPWPGTDSVHHRAVSEAIGPDLPDLTPLSFFVGGDDGVRVMLASGASAGPDSIVRAAADAARDSLPKWNQFRMVVIPAGRDTALAFLIARPHPTAEARWVGFTISVENFRAQLVAPRLAMLARSFHWLEDSTGHVQSRMARDSLPPLAISLVSSDGKMLYRTAHPPQRRWYGSRIVAGGFATTLNISLEPAAIPVLMQGGYPVNHSTLILLVLSSGVLLLLAAGRLVSNTLALARQREEFTSSVSHELRTPLTNIQLFAETLLLERARTGDERRNALQTITRETRRLVHMVENVLSLSRVGRPALTLVRRRERIDQLVRDVVASFEPLLESRNIELCHSFDGEPFAAIDGDALRRILVNLLDNAVRYGPMGQIIQVTTTHRNSQVIVAVEDQGPGVPITDRERIWRAFERGSATHEGGTGIGLAVVSQLVRLHGGTARVEDTRTGARFVVILPAPGIAVEDVA
jgi:signal transduction histidine kinase